MEIYATTVYVISEEILKVLGVIDNPQSSMTNAEIMTFAILSARYFASNHKTTRYICKRLHLFKVILSNSRMNRRIHRIPWNCWHAVFRLLALFFKETTHEKIFAVDSFPVACCQKNRIDKRKFFIKREYIGYAASKKRHFCGIKVHMVVTGDGKPIEIHFMPGAESDLNVLWKMELNIPFGSELYADGAYNCFDLEDILEEEGIKLLAKRGHAATNRLRSDLEEKTISSRRQIIETVFSCITGLFPKNLKVRTEAGFMIKVFCSVLAYSLSLICKSSLT